MHTVDTDDWLATIPVAADVAAQRHVQFEALLVAGDGYRVQLDLGQVRVTVPRSGVVEVDRLGLPDAPDVVTGVPVVVMVRRDALPPGVTAGSRAAHDAATPQRPFSLSTRAEPTVPVDHPVYREREARFLAALRARIDALS